MDGKIFAVTNIFAVSAKANGNRIVSSRSLKERWEDRLKAVIGGGNTKEKDCIFLKK
jgi:hypothetical protein